MIYLLVLHILACTDDVPDSYCTSSLLLHILTCMAHSLYKVFFYQRVIKKGFNILIKVLIKNSIIWAGSEKRVQF